MNRKDPNLWVFILKLQAVIRSSSRNNAKKTNKQTNKQTN